MPVTNKLSATHPKNYTLKLSWVGKSSAISTKAPDSIRFVNCGETGEMAAPIDTSGNHLGLGGGS